MPKITQSQKTITADFTTIESQYQHNSFMIDVELTDNTFGGYSVMASVNNPAASDFSYTLPIINNKITLPYYVTNKIGVLTISLFGVKGAEIMTTNICKFYVAKSNPSNVFELVPQPNWLATLSDFIEALGAKIVPTIDKVTNNWFIGGVDTGVSANGILGEDIAAKFDKINKDLKSEQIKISINPNQWGSDNSYTYSNSKITETCNIEVLPPVMTNNNTDMLLQIQNANLQNGGQWNGGFKIICLGDKPSNIIELILIFRGEK